MITLMIIKPTKFAHEGNVPSFSDSTVQEGNQVVFQNLILKWRIMLTNLTRSTQHLFKPWLQGEINSEPKNLDEAKQKNDFTK